MSTLLVADIGGTTVKIGFVVEGVPQTYQRVFPTSHLRRPYPVAGLAEMISLAIDEAKLQPHAIVSTVPGFLDKTATRVLLAVNIPELNGCALVDALARVLGIPVILERDAVLSLIGEHAAGGCRGAQSVLGFFFRNRCRRGVSPERTRLPRVWLGARGRTHALSRVASMVGAERTECLEAYVSGKVLERIAREHGVAIADVFSAAKHNRELGEHVAEFVRNQANAVGCAIAVLSPETVLLGGGICDMPEFPREQLASAIQHSFPFEQIGQPLAVQWATLGWQSVLHGAPLIQTVRDRQRS